MTPPPVQAHKTTNSEKRANILNKIRAQIEEKKTANASGKKLFRKRIITESSEDEEGDDSIETESLDPNGESSSLTSAISKFIVDDTGDILDHPRAAEKSNTKFDDDDSNLKEQFWICVHYMIHIDINPDVFDEVDLAASGYFTVSISIINNRLLGKYFSKALMAVKNITRILAEQIARQTWKAPFRTTLELRPRVRFSPANDGTQCQACWTRTCGPEGFYRFTSATGVYDTDTLKVRKIIDGS